MDCDARPNVPFGMAATEVQQELQNWYHKNLPLPLAPIQGFCFNCKKRKLAGVFQL
jgi:hypothetical protein